jgi:glycerate kinase
LTVALDVQNPLLGIRGCTRVYGPQKGLRSQEFSKAEAALQRMSGLMALERGVSMAKVSGAGAAGGLGFGLMAFLKAQPVEGFSLFAQAAGLKQRVREADLIITGEGCLDAQSMMGKGVGALAKLSRQSGVPCIAIAGSAPEPAAGEGGLASIYVLDHLTTRSQALNEPARWVSQAAKVAAQDWSSTL